MLVNLAELALRGGERYERAYPVDPGPIVLGGAEYRALAPEGARLTVDRVTGGFLVGVVLDAKVYGPCARCLGEAVVSVHAEEQEFAPTAKDGWEETESSEFIDDLVVDVDGLAREALILALPAQVVCSEECKGLCPHCGVDLNAARCDCVDTRVDERWSRLKDVDLRDRGQDPDEGAGP